jgi:hypothetical protein
MATADDGLAIGLDLSLSKVVRARTISQGRAVLRYPVREQEGLIEAEIQGQDRLRIRHRRRSPCSIT